MLVAVCTTQFYQLRTNIHGCDVNSGAFRNIPKDNVISSIIFNQDDNNFVHQKEI